MDVDIAGESKESRQTNWDSSQGGPETSGEMTLVSHCRLKDCETR
jgi:hypothetical protein